MDMGLKDAIGSLDEAAKRLAENTESIRCLVVERHIRSLGLTVSRREGEWRINYPGAPESAAYYTTDNQDAIATAKVMAEHYRGGGVLQSPDEPTTGDPNYRGPREY